jgi:hypothetical protein
MAGPETQVGAAADRSPGVATLMSPQQDSVSAEAQQLLLRPDTEMLQPATMEPNDTILNQTSPDHTKGPFTRELEPDNLPETAAAQVFEAADAAEALPGSCLPADPAAIDTQMDLLLAPPDARHGEEPKSAGVGMVDSAEETAPAPLYAPADTNTTSVSHAGSLGLSPQPPSTEGGHIVHEELPLQVPVKPSTASLPAVSPSPPTVAPAAVAGTPRLQQTVAAAATPPSGTAAAHSTPSPAPPSGTPKASELGAHSSSTPLSAGQVRDSLPVARTPAAKLPSPSLHQAPRPLPRPTAEGSAKGPTTAATVAPQETKTNGGPCKMLAPRLAPVLAPKLNLPAKPLGSLPTSNLLSRAPLPPPKSHPRPPQRLPTSGGLLKPSMPPTIPGLPTSVLVNPLKTPMQVLKPAGIAGGKASALKAAAPSLTPTSAQQPQQRALQQQQQNELVSQQDQHNQQQTSHQAHMLTPTPNKPPSSAAAGVGGSGLQLGQCPSSPAVLSKGTNSNGSSPGPAPSMQPMAAATPMELDCLPIHVQDRAGSASPAPTALSAGMCEGLLEVTPARAEPGPSGQQQEQVQHERQLVSPEPMEVAEDETDGTLASDLSAHMSRLETVSTVNRHTCSVRTLSGGQLVSTQWSTCI